MRENLALQVGQAVSIKGVKHTFYNAVRLGDHNSEEADDLQFLEVANHAITRLKAEEFHALVASGDIRLPTRGERGIVDAPEAPCDAGDACPSCRHCKSRKMRANRLALLKAFDENPVGKSDRSLTAWLSAERDKVPYPTVKVPKAAVLRRLLRERGEPSDRRPYQMHDHYGGGRRRRVSSDYLSIFDELSPWYWSNVANHASDLHDKISARMNALNLERRTAGQDELPIPSRQTTWRLLRAQQNFDNVRRRCGRRAAERLYKPIAGSLEVNRILELAAIDHTVLDCFVIDDKERVVIGRPYPGTA